MKVKIALNLPKTINGQPLGPFRKGEEVDLPEDLAKIFIESNMASRVLPPKPAPKKEGAEAGEKKPAAKQAESAKKSKAK